jgi:hypothetical protein
MNSTLTMMLKSGKVNAAEGNMYSAGGMANRMALFGRHLSGLYVKQAFRTSRFMTYAIPLLTDW